MKRQSAGILLYRCNQNLQVLLAHPGGPYWQNTDLGAWTIPKGEIQPNENALETACREFKEETGIDIDVNDTFLNLGSASTKNKTNQIWALQKDWDASKQPFKSNTCVIMQAGKSIEIPEIDRLEWFDLVQAKLKIRPAMLSFLENLEHATSYFK